MNGIVINIEPVAFRIGHFPVHWFSLLVASAITVAVIITVRVARKKGIAAEDIYRGIPWAVLGGLVGARLLHVVDHWEHFLANPAQILGGMGLAVYGALIGGALASIMYARVRRIPVGRAADSVAPGLLVGLMIGRVGCIINGDVWGSVTDLPWAFVYTHPDAMLPRALLGEPTHPYPLYEIIWNAAVLLVMWQLGPRLKRDWMVFLGYAALYSLGRFILMFARDQRVWFWGLQQTQIVALLVLVIALATVIYLAIARSRPGSAERDTGDLEASGV